MADSQNLGALQGNVMVFGGPYGNLEATVALRAEAARLNIPPGNCICTGDSVAYCADPAATVALLRDWGVPVVMGNCEQSLAMGAADCGCGFAPGSACDLLSRQWFDYSSRHLDEECRTWMGRLPRVIRFELAGRRGAVIHGGAADISQFVFASTAADEKIRQATALDAQIVLAGHCGLPFTHDLGNDLVWHNAGVIGMPANDGTPDVWYALLAPRDGGLAISHHRLAYDYRAAAARLRAEGLADGYANALESGLWPSLDVLPRTERRAAGRRLAL